MTIVTKAGLAEYFCVHFFVEADEQCFSRHQGGGTEVASRAENEL